MEQRPFLQLILKHCKSRKLRDWAALSGHRQSYGIFRKKKQNLPQHAVKGEIFRFQNLDNTAGESLVERYSVWDQEHIDTIKVYNLQPWSFISMDSNTVGQLRDISSNSYTTKTQSFIHNFQGVASRSATEI